MPSVSWIAAADGRYWIDVEIDSRPEPVMIDLGLVDPLGAVGFELEPAVYDRLKQNGGLSRFQYRFRRDANAQVTVSESGATTVQLFDPDLRQAIGPAVQLHVCKGAAGVPSRVGVVFFHHLTGCKVRWELDTRTWQMELP